VVRQIPQDVETIGDAARRLQEAAGWTQTEAAAAVGISQPEWSRLCLNKNLNPRQKLLSSIDDAFNLQPGTFAGIVHEATLARRRKEQEGRVPFEMVAIGPAEPVLLRLLEAVRDKEPEEIEALATRIKRGAKRSPFVWLRRSGSPAPSRGRRIKYG
jgi:transcriptional regulator with XRE-family HTH domain